MIGRGAASVLNETVVSYMLGVRMPEVTRVEPLITGYPSRGFELLFGVVMSNTGIDLQDGPPCRF